MRFLKVKETVNIGLLIFLIMTWPIIIAIFAGYAGLIDASIDIHPIYIVGILIMLIILSGVEINMIVNAREVVEISEEGIRCVNYPSRTSACIKWDAVVGVDYETAWTRYDYDKVIVFVNGRFKGKANYYPLKSSKEDKQEMLKAVIINTSGTYKTRKIYKTIHHNMMI